MINTTPLTPTIAPDTVSTPTSPVPARECDSCHHDAWSHHLPCDATPECTCRAVPITVISRASKRLAALVDAAEPAQDGEMRDEGVRDASSVPTRTRAARR